MALLDAETGSRDRHRARPNPVPLPFLALLQRLADLLHLFVLGVDLGGEGLAARPPVGGQFVRLLAELRVPPLQRLVLLAFSGEASRERGAGLLQLVELGQQAFAVEPPLDLVRLQRVPVPGDHAKLVTKAGRVGGARRHLGMKSAGHLLGRLQLLADAGHLPLGYLDGLAGPVAVGGGQVPSGGGLLALPPHGLQFLLELRQPAALGGDRLVDGPQRLAEPVLFGLDRLPFGGPLAAGFLMAGEFDRERLGHRFHAREKLPPLVDSFAERAGQVRRVRHAPITAGGARAGTSIRFRPGPGA